MIYSVQQIKFEILAYIKEFGSTFEDWYIGISSDPLNELTDNHLVDKETDIWLYKQALTPNACQTVQQYFIDTLKVDGTVIKSNDIDMDCVYLFKKSDRTQPQGNRV